METLVNCPVDRSYLDELNDDRCTKRCQIGSTRLVAHFSYIHDKSPGKASKSNDSGNPKVYVCKSFKIQDQEILCEELDKLKKAKESLEGLKRERKLMESKFSLGQDMIENFERLTASEQELIDLYERRLQFRIELVREVHLRATNFINGLMNTPYETISIKEGLQILRNIPSLQKSGTIHDIIVRKITEPFWRDCIKFVDGEDEIRVAVIGTPGIGKTTSTPILIRILLEQYETVVYLIRSHDKSKWYYEFTRQRSDGSIMVQIYPESWFDTYIRSLQSRDTYYIIDAGTSNDSCKPSPSFVAKVIIVAPPNSCHWGGYRFLKSYSNSRYGKFMYYPMWSLDELLCARAILNKDMTEEEIFEGYRNFGGVPQRVFNKNNWIEFLSEQSSAMLNLSSHDVEDIAFHECHANNTYSNGAPNWVIQGYGSSKESFDELNVFTISSRVADNFYTRYIKDVWTKMLRDKKNGPNILRAYTRSLLADGRIKRFVYRTYEARKKGGQGEKVAVFSKSNRIHLGGCRQIKLVSDPILAALMPESKPNLYTLYHAIDEADKPYDFVYKDENDHIHAFQIAVNNSHEANFNRVREIEEMVVGGASEFSLYYLVPNNDFVSFATIVPMNTNNDGTVHKIFIVMIPQPCGVANSNSQSTNRMLNI